jgi:hypothetical protein
MTASFAFLLIAIIVMVAVFVVALIAMGGLFGKSFAEQANIQQFQASLVKRLPPDVQADMKSGQLGIVISLAIALIVLPSIVAGLIATGKARGLVFVGYGLGAVACAVWTAALARIWLDRRNPGEVLADFSPHPLAGAVRRSFWVLALILSTNVFLTAFEGHLLFLAVQVSFVLLILLANLMYSDRSGSPNVGFTSAAGSTPGTVSNGSPGPRTAEPSRSEGGAGDCSGAGQSCRFPTGRARRRRRPCGR